MQDDQITFTTTHNKVLVNSQSVDTSSLSVEDKTVVSFNQYEFHLIKREIGYALRLIDNSMDKSKLFKGTKFYPFNQSWVVPARLIQHESPRTIRIPTVYGTIRNDDSAGWLEFDIRGTKHKLQAVNYGKESPMYVMFSDKTSGDVTYGAGRYLEVNWPDENGNTYIDFNRAYNPACAFTNYATCPLTPPQNRLTIDILAGELDVIK